MNKSVLKSGLFASFIVFTLACKEKDLTGNNEVPPSENVSLGASLLYGDEILYKDSIYTNSQGNRFFIEDLKLLISDFYIVENQTDTITTEGNYRLYDLDNKNRLIYQLPPRGYSGRYGINVGLDSLSTEFARQNSLDSESPLNELGIMRNDIYGYNFLVITGKAFDLTNPDDTLGNIRFAYELGTYMLTENFESTQLNFAVSKERNAGLVMVVDFKPVLDVINITNTPFVVSDTTNAIDFALAKLMVNELSIGLF